MARPQLIRLGWLILVIVAIGIAAGAQPPMPLPPSVTKSSPSTTPVSPAAGSVTQPGTPPIARFQELNSFPAETVQAVYSVRSGAEWLWRMNQANGRFFSGINPALRLPADGENDLHQAFATLALAEAARFTGEERYAARAAQAVLALLALTREDPAHPGQRIPVAPSERCNRLAFAAVTILAIHTLPNPEALKTGEAEALAAFLLTRIRADGSFQLGDTTEEPPNPKISEESNLYPGLAVQALVASYRLKPDEAKRSALGRVLGHYREAVKTSTNPLLAVSLLPAYVELASSSNPDATMTAAAFELADLVCRCQYSRTETRNLPWIGGFRSSSAIAAIEPGFESAMCLRGLIPTLDLTRRVPDLGRFRSYRLAVVEGLAFVRSLQFTDENADHFERSFRARFLVGGCHLRPSDGTVRIDATALLVSSQLQFLQSEAALRSE